MSTYPTQDEIRAARRAGADYAGLDQAHKERSERLASVRAASRAFREQRESDVSAILAACARALDVPAAKLDQPHIRQLAGQVAHHARTLASRSK